MKLLKFIFKAVPSSESTSDIIALNSSFQSYLAIKYADFSLFISMQRIIILSRLGPPPADQLYKPRSSETYHLFWNSRYQDNTDPFWRDHYIK
jgi:hypothetical protein